MKAWGVLVVLVVAGAQVSAEEPLSFPEDATRMAGSRIVSGWDAEEGQIPWQLSMRMVNPTGAVNSCGGSIIHPEWGMTAAHCTATRVTMVLRAGAVSLWRPELLFETTEYYNHPLYIDALVSVVQPHDIALLKFPRAIPFSDRVQPIRLQRDVEKNRNYAGVRLEASGWGRTWTNGPAPDDLQWVYLRGDSNLACWFAFGGSSIIVDSTICASAYNVTSQSTCQGDSGGPLVELEEDGKYTMVGVTSFVSGAGCHADFPAGFIRPGHYHSWFTEITGLNFDWDPEAPTEPPSAEDSSSSSESSSSESNQSSDSSSEETPEESEETPEVSEEAPEESEETPEVSEETPEVSEEAPEVSEETPEESEETPEVSEETPEVSEEAPEVSEETPEESEETPEVSEETPEVSEEAPEVSEEAPEESEETPEVSEETPEVSEETPEVSEETPEVSEETPEVSEETPEVSEETPEVSEETPEASEEAPEVSEEAPEVSEETPEAA